MKVGQHNSCRVRTNSTRVNTEHDRGQIRHRNGQRMDGKLGRQSPWPSPLFASVCLWLAPSRYMYGNCNCQFKYAQTNFTVCCPDRKLKGRPAREKSWQHRLLFLNLAAQSSLSDGLLRNWYFVPFAQLSISFNLANTTKRRLKQGYPSSTRA